MCIFLVTVFMYVFGCAYSEPNETNPYTEALKARPWQSIQDYVEVRPGAFLFYWLYYADGKADDAEHKPLVIWIEGGPTYSATGWTNFAQLGPLDTDMKPRNHNWVNGKKLLLIDHPVGTGFSYVTNTSLYVKIDSEMAFDLQKAIKAFFKKHKQFRKTPTYIVGQGYGGKLAPILGFYLHKAIQRKQLKMNFKGIGIGGGYVDPKETAYMQPQFLYMMVPCCSKFSVEMLLDNTKLKVAVFNGNLDATTPLTGTSNWVHNLKWHGAQAFQNADSIPIRGLNNGFYKMKGQLTFWAVLQSGHWVPEDNPEAMEQILEHFISENITMI